MLLRDEEGRELPDLSADHAVAVMSAPSILCDEVLSGRVSLNGAIDVRDEEGAQVETVKFSQAVVIEAEVTEPVRS